MVIQSLQHAGCGRASNGEGCGGGGGGGWGAGTSGGEWDVNGNGSEYGDVAPEGFAGFFGGDVPAAAAAEHSSHGRDVSRPTAVAPGQAVECRLPARPDWRDDGSAVAADFLVQVPGYHTVAGIRIGARGARAYPLVAEAGAAGTGTGRESTGASRKAHGVAERLMRASGRGGASGLNKMGLAIVVDVGEKTSTAATGGGGQTAADGADERSSMASSSSLSASPLSRGGLVAELRTNVCVHNASASDVEVDMAETASAAAAIATNPGARRPPPAAQQGRTVAAAAGDGGSASGSGGGGGGGSGGTSSAVVRLAAGARLALPLPVLSSWQLRVAGDATDAWSRPLRLSPALLDPAVPNALRLTSDMERNSLCLRMTKSSGRASVGGAVGSAAAQGETYTTEPGGAGDGAGRRQVLAASPEHPGGDDEPRRKTAPQQRVGFNLQHSPRSPSSRTAPVSPRRGDDHGHGFAGRPSLKGSPSPPSSLTPGKMSAAVSGTGSGGGASFPPAASGTADWVLMIQPSYLVTNALPCTMEVEVLQPPPQPLTAAVGGTDAAARGERHRSWAGADSSGGIDPEEAKDTAGSDSWRDGSGDGDGDDDGDGDGDSNMSSDDDSDTLSVASSITSRQTQQSEGKARAEASSARVVKAAVRNPALDLFFLPTSSSAASSPSPAMEATGGGGLGRAKSGSRVESGGGGGNRTRSWSGVDAGGGSGADGARRGRGSEAGAAKQQQQRGWPFRGASQLQRQQQQQEEGESEEYEDTRGLESVWKGLIGSGQEAKV